MEITSIHLSVGLPIYPSIDYYQRQNVLSGFNETECKSSL